VTANDAQDATHPAAIIGLDHVGITVRNLDASLAFYRDLLGLRVIEISDEEDASTIVGITGARIRAADLDTGDGRVFELLEYVAAKGPALEQQPNQAGCAHVALRVNDIDAVLARLASAGYHPDGTPTLITGAIAWEGATVVYLRDPDGAVLELVQRRPPRAEEVDAAVRTGASRRRSGKRRRWQSPTT
jgi:catechol 2,3-dioxygenase-like lactoylglutathione lyase family enzyme